MQTVNCAEAKISHFHFPFLGFRGKGGFKFSIYFVQDCSPLLGCPWPQEYVSGTHSYTKAKKG